MKPSPRTIRRRIADGWTEDEARNTPPLNRSQAASYALKKRKKRHPWKAPYKHDEVK